MSSFGASGTITHGLFASKMSDASSDCHVKELFFSFLRLNLLPLLCKLPIHFGLPRNGGQPSAMTGALSPYINATLSDHVVGGKILLPGVGYQEIAGVAVLGSGPALVL